MATLALDDAAWASPWRRHRVGEKVLWSGALVVTALAVPSIWATVAAGVVALALVLGPARIPASMVVTAMAVPFGFICVGAISVLCSVGRDPVDAYWSLGLLSVGPESVSMAWRLFLHAICGTLAVMLLALTTPMSDLLNWMERHRVPGPLVDIASLTYRMLFILLDTATSLLDAQHRRCGRVTLHSAGAVTGTLLLRAWDRAQRLEQGLTARGMEEGLRTTALPRQRSWAMLGGCALTVAGIWILGVWLPWR
uniref:cobalt ECF transporter T component CbiQ n=1 Tax=Tessaracoccus timonensis TaxID=2161816 RepID=UPI001E2D8A0F|nr:cobalt ECF transporter T component CbiQ [Tessaracoccus timonensis]